jgi:hypothetical protein
LPSAASAPAYSDAIAGEKKSKKRQRPGIAARPAAGALPGAAVDVPAAVDPTAGKRGDKKLRKGARGTEMSEDFE